MSIAQAPSSVLPTRDDLDRRYQEWLAQNPRIVRSISLIHAANRCTEHTTLLDCGHTRPYQLADNVGLRAACTVCDGFVGHCWNCRERAWATNGCSSCGWTVEQEHAYIQADVRRQFATLDAETQP